MDKNEVLKKLAAQESLGMKPKETIGWEDVENVAYEIEYITGADVKVCERCSSGGSDYWLQAEYYSPILKTTIVVDYDFWYRGDDGTLKDLVDDYYECWEKAQKIDKTLKFMIDQVLFDTSDYVGVDEEIGIAKYWGNIA